MTATDNNDEVVTDLFPFYRAYKDGRVQRFYDDFGAVEVPPSAEDPETGVSSKDINISPDISARLYLPKNNTKRLPILVYYHGGGLVVGSPFFSTEHRYLNILVSESNCVAITINYRLAPEHDLHTIFQDCWTALQWVASHADYNHTSSINNQEPWITNHGDFSRVFIAGDSAGGNIVFNMAMRAGRESLNGDVKLLGVIMCFPFFLIPVENVEQFMSYKIWSAICPPSEQGINSPMINPLAEKGSCLSGLRCARIFLCTAEKDELLPREIGSGFVEAVNKSGWKGELEFIEIEGEDHCFQGANPESEKAKDLIKRIASFIQRM